MKRVFSLALAALLLAGCTAAPANPVQTEETAAATPAPAAEEAEETAAAPVLRELTPCTLDRYYKASAIDDSGQIFLTTIDLNDGRQRVACTKPGCAHTGPDCWAWLQDSTVGRPNKLELYTDGEQLYWVNLTDYGHYDMGTATGSPMGRPSGRSSTPTRRTKLPASRLLPLR